MRRSTRGRFSPSLPNGRSSSFRTSRAKHPSSTLCGTTSQASPHLSPETQERLTAIADTQFFSRFEILGKDTERLICTLRDVCDNARYAVYDPYLCSVERWNTGTIAERIARVDGMWRGIGRVHLYDRAPHEATDEDGPGMFHPEDRTRKPEGAYLGFYLRLVRDIAGREGRYRAGATYGVAQAMP